MIKSRALLSLEGVLGLILVSLFGAFLLPHFAYAEAVPVSDPSAIVSLLDAGADKISINSAAVRNPSLIDQIAGKYGSQFVVLAVDAKRVSLPEDCVGGEVPAGEGSRRADRWLITTHGGRQMTDVELFSWVREGQERGAGEILLTSMDHDGTKAGYPCDLFARLSEILTIPIIASGGAGSAEDIAAVLSEGRADAALAASIFHYGEMTVGQLKSRLREMDIPVRI